MKHLESTSSTDTQLFDKSFMANTLVFQPLLCCFVSCVMFSNVLVHFVSCTYIHFPEGFLASLPIVTTLCLLMNFLSLVLRCVFFRPTSLARSIGLASLCEQDVFGARSCFLLCLIYWWQRAPGDSEYCALSCVSK